MCVQLADGLVASFTQASPNLRLIIYEPWSPCRAAVLSTVCRTASPETPYRVCSWLGEHDQRAPMVLHVAQRVTQMKPVFSYWQSLTGFPFPTMSFEKSPIRTQIHSVRQVNWYAFGMAQVNVMFAQIAVTADMCTVERSTKVILYLFGKQLQCLDELLPRSRQCDLPEPAAFAIDFNVHILCSATEVLHAMAHRFGQRFSITKDWRCAKVARCGSLD